MNAAVIIIIVSTQGLKESELNSPVTPFSPVSETRVLLGGASESSSRPSQTNSTIDSKDGHLSQRAHE